ncbi:MAG: UDP-2,3-diacylglucosamine diphosphatase LpxI [Proteobacteria bacterium]|nr:UDP-2,3-diacylglucosamine diphosphatase LpxI [Pseudomonadota bacterium]
MSQNRGSARLPRLTVLAGAGPLPGDIVAACEISGREVFIVAHKGITDPDVIGSAPHEWVHLGAMERTIALLHEQRTEEIVFAGPIERPSLTSLRLDGRALKLMSRWRKNDASGGDDKLLSAIVGELESEGFRIVGIDSILPDILAPMGVLGALSPDDAARADIAVGCRVARSLGSLDIGQAVVVQQGVVLGVEAVEGTDGLLARCRDLRREGPGGVLVKLKEPGQEARVDLPAIGAVTVEGARAAALAGIAVEAGGALVIDLPEVIAAADEAGLFVIGVSSSGVSPDNP